MLQRDEQSLTRILQGLDELEAEPDGEEPPPLDVVSLAEARQHRGGGAA